MIKLVKPPEKFISVFFSFNGILNVSLSLATSSSISKNCHNLHLISEFVWKLLLLEQTIVLVKELSRVRGTGRGESARFLCHPCDFHWGLIQMNLCSFVHQAFSLKIMCVFWQ